MKVGRSRRLAGKRCAISEGRSLWCARPTDMKSARVWFVGALIVVAIGIGVFVSARAGKKPPVQYETVKVDQGRITAKVTATGTLSALVTVQVGSQVSGRIAQLFVDFNSPVKKGQVIAKIDPSFFKAAVEQARANYAAAKGNLEKAKAQAIDAERQFQRAAGARREAAHRARPTATPPRPTPTRRQRAGRGVARRRSSRRPRRCIKRR